MNITPNVETTTSKLSSANGSASASASRNSISEPLGRGALAPAFEQRRHVVGRGHLAPAARRGERHVAVAGRDVEHLAAGAQIERLAQLLADDLQRGADDGVVAGRPGALLARLDGGEIGLDGSAVCRVAAAADMVSSSTIERADRGLYAERCVNAAGFGFESTLIFP